MADPQNLISAKRAGKVFGFLSNSTLVHAAKRGTIEIGLREGRNVWYDRASIERAIAAGALSPGTRHRTHKRRNAAAPVQRAPESAGDKDLERMCLDIGHGAASPKEIAKRYGVSETTVYNIRRELKKRGVSLPGLYKTNAEMLDRVAAAIKAKRGPAMSNIG